MSKANPYLKDDFENMTTKELFNEGASRGNIWLQREAAEKPDATPYMRSCFGLPGYVKRP